jgi:hypothetical protein
MNFELGKSYIVNVTEKGIIPLMEFDRSKWYNKDYDDLDFLTDAEKNVIINSVLNKIRAEIEQAVWEDCIVSCDVTDEIRIPRLDPDDVFEIIDRYRVEGSKAESEE